MPRVASSGREAYFPIYHLFMSARALYVIVVNVLQDSIEWTVEAWVNFLSARPSVRLFSFCSLHTT